VPEWVTAIPSSTRPGMVGGFARALARELGLPYVECLAVGSGEPQAAMRNSVQQLANAHDRLGVAAGVSIPAGPVLLVDDLVDSGWTLTVAGWLLRDAGSGPVHPFALAAASAREG
jgi:ATP-dependent DNA helicase RecQ